MPPFMTQIEEAQRAPLDQLALDYLPFYSRQPSIDFCCRTIGVCENDAVVAQRLGVKTSEVRAWREVGRRMNGRSA